MITTLLKHEWMRTRGLVGAVAAAATLAVAVGTGLAFTELPVLSQLGSALALVVLVALLPLAQIALAFDFWRSSFRRTGYFTHSLPIRGGTIFWTKLLWGAIVTVGLLVLNVLLVALFWAAFGPVLDLSRNFFADISTVFELMPASFTTAMSLMVVLSGFGWLAQLYFAATLGSGRALGRFGIGGPVIVYVAMYMITQVAMFAGILLIPFGLEFAPGTGGASIDYNLVNYNVLSDMLSATPSQTMPLGFLPVLLVVLLVSVGWSTRIWNRKVALA